MLLVVHPLGLIRRQDGVRPAARCTTPCWSRAARALISSARPVNGEAGSARCASCPGNSCPLLS